MKKKKKKKKVEIRALWSYMRLPGGPWLVIKQKGYSEQSKNGDQFLENAISWMGGDTVGVAEGVAQLLVRN